MKDILLTSSALILALLLLRRVFKGILSRRLQYALWALVLVRLLVPANLPAVDFSLLTAAKPIQTAVDQRLEQVVRPAIPQTAAQPGADTVDPNGFFPTQGQQMILDHESYEGPLPQWDNTNYPATYQPAGSTTQPATGITAGQALALVWKTGMVVMAGFFLLSNLWFYRRLRKNRQAFETEAARPVYLVPDGVIPSPCLFGRSIYLTPAVARDSAKLRHVLAHEETHARHLDPLWSLLRCVCLTVYWFDPLVWIAAACSKADCELACDESALSRLGEEERIPYGETLLSLIPVRWLSNPLLSATTMTAGKKQLKDRITRIAQKPRQLVAAVLAVAILAGLAAACTFTGAVTFPAPDPTPAEDGLRALTVEELRWFNEEFFNSAATDQGALYASRAGGDDIYYNIRNQFANPINRYEKPEDIDLFELLYLEGSYPSDREIRDILGMDPDEMPCAAYKLTTAEMDEMLVQYTGLTVAQTNKVGLDGFIYDETTDAYYWSHGDTNYCGDLNFTVGTREGNIVKLYRERWYCVTLEEQADGSYWFRSNLKCDQPAIPTPLPAWEAAATISLKELEPYVAPNVTAVEHQDDQAQRMAGYQVGEQVVRFYRSTDGNVYAAVELEATETHWRGNCFLTLPGDRQHADYDVEFFYDLMGRDGIAISYWDATSGLDRPTWDFYYFADQTPVLLVRATASSGVRPQALDLDGDGKNDLVTNEELFFERDGLLYRADLRELLQTACPELSYWDYSYWDIYSKCLCVRGYTENYKDWKRYLYFDGENILIYKDETPTTDHMVEGIDRGVPAQVVEQARAFAQSVYESWKGGGGMELDDWRIESFSGPARAQVGNLTVMAWAFNYECHTTTPEDVMLAGGRYITEDDWVSPGYPGADYLFFLVDRHGNLNYQWHAMLNDMGPGSPYYAQYLEERLTELGYGDQVAAAPTAAAQDAAEKLHRIISLSNGYVTLHLNPVDGDASAYTVYVADGNGSYYQRTFTDPELYSWRYVDSFPGYPEGTSLTITDPSWEYYIRLWEGSDYVMIKPNDTGALWYEVKQEDDDVYATDIFHFMRRWFDDVELSALQGNIAVPDREDSPLNIVRDWAQAYEGAYLNLTPGNYLRCTFMKLAGVGTLEDMPEVWFPAEIREYPHFAFVYDTIFVPEGSDGLNWFMAGTTGEYEGPDPDAPEGAFTYSRVGSMYLKDGYWYCGGVGTG